MANALDDALADNYMKRDVSEEGVGAVLQQTAFSVGWQVPGLRDDLRARVRSGAKAKAIAKVSVLLAFGFMASLALIKVLLRQHLGKEKYPLAQRKLLARFIAVQFRGAEPSNVYRYADMCAMVAQFSEKLLRRSSIDLLCETAAGNAMTFDEFDAMIASLASDEQADAASAAAAAGGGACVLVGEGAGAAGCGHKEGVV